MGLRGALQKHRSLIAIVSVITVIGCTYWIFKGDPTKALPKQVYFYDLATGQLYPADLAARPPLKTAGGEGVKAITYGCGGCDGNAPAIAYLISMAADGEVVALPSKEKTQTPAWVLTGTLEGDAITNRLRDICGEQPAVECFPN